MRPIYNLTSVERAQRAFTLIELVVVIAVMAILGGISVTFISHSIFGYVNSTAYYQLADRADVALRRMSRDVRNALPNSVWVASDGSYVEFIPIKNAGRYQQDTLDFVTANDSFNVIGPAIASVSSGDQLVIYNLGIQGADVYAGDTIRSLTTTGSSLATLAFSGSAFPLSSPNNRFYIVNSASFYVCDLANNRLMMYTGYAVPSSHPSSGGVSGTGSIVADNLTGCSFTYTPGVMQHNGVLTASLQFTKNGGVVNLVNQINVVNSP